MMHKPKQKNEFDSEQWINEKKDELVNTMFMNEFGIADFRNTNTILNFDDLQSPDLIKRFDKYRESLHLFFKGDQVRSTLNYYFQKNDKKPVLNLLKQILKNYNYKLKRISEYQGNSGGLKTYVSKYTIAPNDEDLDA